MIGMRSAPSLSSTGFRRALAWVTPLLAFLVLAGWSVSSPLGATPDEDYHLRSIWCAWGVSEGSCEVGSDGASRSVPTPFDDIGCFVQDFTESAVCNELDTDTMQDIGPDRINSTSSLYPPVFYATMGLFAGDDYAVSVVTMRLFNSALAVLLLTAIFWALPRPARPALVVSVLVTSVPLGLFSLASINPSSWAVLSGATVWISVYGAMITRGRRQWILAGLALLATVIGAGARADAAAYAVFGALLGAFLGLRQHGGRRSWVFAGGLVGALGVLSAVLYLSAAQGGAIATGMRPIGEDEAPFTLTQHVQNLLEIPQLWIGVFSEGLGWLDTHPPALAWVLASGVCAGAILLGLRSVTLRRGLAVGAAFLAIWLVPFVLLAQSRSFVGQMVQPRYLLPLIIVLVGVCALTPGRLAWTRTRVVVAGGALVVAQLLSQHTLLRRYTVGIDQPALDPGANAEWWWYWQSPSPRTVLVLTTLAFAALVVALELARTIADRTPDPLDPDADTAGGVAVDDPASTDPETAVLPVPVTVGVLTAPTVTPSAPAPSTAPVSAPDSARTQVLDLPDQSATGSSGKHSSD